MDVTQHSSLALSSLVAAEGRRGQRVIGRTEPLGDERWRAQFVTPFETESVEVEPTGEIFDFDRFNNRSGVPGFQLFPGSAQKISDRDYTLFWLPYPFRRPRRTAFASP